MDISALTTPAETADMKTSTAAASQELSNQFLHLLVAQLKNQDPLEPMKNEQFITELAQLQSLDTSIKIADSNQALLLQSSLATGSGLIGKEVTGMVVEKGVTSEVNGVVKSVKVESGEVLYVLKDKSGVEHTLEADSILNVTMPLASGLNKPQLARR